MLCLVCVIAQLTHFEHSNQAACHCPLADIHNIGAATVDIGGWGRSLTSVRALVPPVIGGGSGRSQFGHVSADNCVCSMVRSLRGVSTLYQAPWLFV